MSIIKLFDDYYKEVRGDRVFIFKHSSDRLNKEEILIIEEVSKQEEKKERREARIKLQNKQ